MRKPLVAGNWKMFKTVAETRHLISELVPGLQSIRGVEKVICPPFTALLAAAALLEGTDIGLGAQNMYWEPSGAFTGEVSPLMIAELCRYVILGHSERRQFFGEDDVMVNRKLQSALAHGLVPIICCGETLDENEAGKTAEVVSRQLRIGLSGLGGLDWDNTIDQEIDNTRLGGGPLVIAYEPVWAIGTGRAATAEGANQLVAEIIRPLLADMFGEAASLSIRVLYGGSVKGTNASEFFVQPDIDGALVGGASLKASEFIQIVQAAAES